MIELQGGDPRVADDPGRLPQALLSRDIRAERSGYVTGIETDEVGRVVMDWGGGRRRLEDKIDYGVGLNIHVKLGDPVKPGTPLVTAYYNDASMFESMADRLRRAWSIDETAPPPVQMIKTIV